MNRSQLMNHVNHLEMEVKVLEGLAEEKAAKKMLDATLVYDTVITVLKNRIEQCRKDLEEDRHEEE
tara:strand:- start:580 stop:777 length:198 start_codon:yes stop_codon:yes gene_type:complete